MSELLAAFTESSTGRPRLGTACFDGVEFSGVAQFEQVTFDGDASFGGAEFDGDARFDGVKVNGVVRFEFGKFGSNALFDRASFGGDAWLAGVHFGGDASFRGTEFGGDVRFGGAKVNGIAQFEWARFTGNASFEQADFSGVAKFNGVKFGGDALFERAGFSGAASFEEVEFGDYTEFKVAAFSRGASFWRSQFGIVSFKRADLSSGASFEQSEFGGNAWFERATFGVVRFGWATFGHDARFDGATFNGDAWFDEATFNRDTEFSGAMFHRNVRFIETRFEGTKQLGPLLADGTVFLHGAVFGEPVTLEIVARAVNCARTQWASKAALRLRYAELDLSDAVMEYPMTVTTYPKLFSLPEGKSLSEGGLASLYPGVSVTSVSGVDTAQLALHDINLSGCRFAGAVHLDQLWVDGWCTFATTPTRRYLRFPWRWSARRTLIEEHHWRVHIGRRSTWIHGWRASSGDSPQLKPAAIAALYRQLRKSLEDGKNEPGAADFYYGECEMRRHDTVDTPWGERRLLTAYWALSGYGLRALRALAWLAAAMTITVLALMVWGLPTDEPKPETIGRQVEAGQKITLVTDTPDPVNPTGPLTERLSTERFEKALRVVINSVVFRSSGQDMTTAGTYTEMASRIGEPVLLGFAVLAVRNRVKR
ncbi:pentapeptide repeat-containing protein [Streptomyces antimycoticus]|uniref:pentapeptide repeat-containing protein n=1 Tax=Streptomyces antimycoticus TaxID=68175 RepID=UPI003446F63D